MKPLLEPKEFTKWIDDFIQLSGDPIIRLDLDLITADIHVILDALHRGTRLHEVEAALNKRTSDYYRQSTIHHLIIKDLKRWSNLKWRYEVARAMASERLTHRFTRRLKLSVNRMRQRLGNTLPPLVVEEFKRGDFTELQNTLAGFSNRSIKGFLLHHNGDFAGANFYT